LGLAAGSSAITEPRSIPSTNLPFENTSLYEPFRRVLSDDIATLDHKFPDNLEQLPHGEVSTYGLKAVL
jgi:hypothetical protein